MASHLLGRRITTPFPILYESPDAAGRWCRACTYAANLAESILKLDSMQKRRKKVPDVIRRGIRLFIGLAVCNSLGFYLSSGGQWSLTFPARPPIPPLPLPSLTHVRMPCAGIKDTILENNVLQGAKWCALHRTTVSFAREIGLAAAGFTPAAIAAAQSAQSACVPWPARAMLLTGCVRIIHRCPMHSLWTGPSHDACPAGHRSRALSCRPPSSAAFPRCLSSARWAPSRAVCSATSRTWSGPTCQRQGSGNQAAHRARCTREYARCSKPSREAAA